MSAGELDVRLARRWALAICAFTGAWGVLTGFAVFILVRTGDFSDPRNFVLALVVATGASFVVETLRETVRGEVAAFPPRHVGPLVVTVLTLLVFELFVFATHNAIEIARDAKAVTELREALLGPALVDAPGATRDLIVLALLWLVPGAAVGWFLGLFIVNDKLDLSIAKRALRGGVRGVGVAVAAAAISVFSYVLVWRFVLAVGLVVAAPADWLEHYNSVLALVAKSHVAVAGDAAVFFVGGMLAIVGFVKLWLWSIAGKLIDVALIAALVGIGVRFKEWRPLGIVAVGFIVGVVAPLYVDLWNVLKLALFAAAVWFVPGLVLGLAAPLLDRPSETAGWWSSIASSLGLVTAILTIARWTEWGWLVYVLIPLAIAFFAVALLFARFRNLEDVWPTLALCLAVIAAGMTALFADRTPSFHTVLVEVSEINRLPASIAPSETVTRYQTSIEMLKFFWRREKPFGAPPPIVNVIYDRAQQNDLATLTSERRTAFIQAQSADVATLRTIGVSELRAGIARERALVRQNRSSQLPPADLAAAVRLSGASLDALLKRNQAYLDAQMTLERGAFSSPSEPVKTAAYAAYDRLFAIARDIESAGFRVLWIDSYQRDLALAGAIDPHEAQAAAADVAFAASLAPKQLEVSLAGSFAFWMTVGILSAWAISRRTETAAP